MVTPALAAMVRRDAPINPFSRNYFFALSRIFFFVSVEESAIFLAPDTFYMEKMKKVKEKDNIVIIIFKNYLTR